MTVSVLNGTLARRFGTDTHDENLRLTTALDGIEPFYTYPNPAQREHVHPYHDCRASAADLERQQAEAWAELYPKSKALGDDRDEPGALAKYESHRVVEYLLSNYIRAIAVPYARSIADWPLADDLSRTALKMADCRQRGPFGINANGKLVVGWESKCGCSKYCPDEALKEARRLSDRYLDAIVEHQEGVGCRVYKAWFTLPNYPPGRLREGIQHLFKRFRDRMIRAQANGRNAFGIEGALVILEAPLSNRGDWNVHLNVILLTRSWLSYKAVRDAWGFNVELRQHRKFDDSGMAGLFNEMVKYSCRAIPEKSTDGRHKAPAMIEWSPEDFCEWHRSMKGFRRTRAYGALHGIGAPEAVNALPTIWLGRMDYFPDGYRVTWRRHDLADVGKSMLHGGAFALESIRGDKSTANRPRAGPS